MLLGVLLGVLFGVLLSVHCGCTVECTVGCTMFIFHTTSPSVSCLYSLSLHTMFFLLFLPVLRLYVVLTYALTWPI